MFAYQGDTQRHLAARIQGMLNVCLSGELIVSSDWCVEVAVKILIAVLWLFEVYFILLDYRWELECHVCHNCAACYLQIQLGEMAMSDIDRVLMTYIWGCSRKDSAGGPYYIVQYYIVYFTLWILLCLGIYENCQKSFCCRLFRSQTTELLMCFNAVAAKTVRDKRELHLQCVLKLKWKGRKIFRRACRRWASTNRFEDCFPAKMERHSLYSVLMLFFFSQNA